MKTKEFVFCFLLGIIYMACDDSSVSRVGLGVQPEEDKVVIVDTTVNIEAKTILVDSIYAKTVNGFLGELYDPSFGSIKSSYICQYYPSIGFPYVDSIVVDNITKEPKIDSVKLNISYSSYLGDSLAPMEVTVYPIIKPLSDSYYTNANPADYCDMANPLAKYSYTARNYNISDSALQASGYSYYLSIPLPVKLGQDYLDKVMEKKSDLTVEELSNFFPGTYITTTFGTGSMIPVYMTNISIYYTYWTMLKDEDGNDSIAYSPAAAVLSVTKEVIQLNSFENKNPAFLSEDNADKTYLKSPAGVFTELTIPIKEIIKGVGKKKFSSVKLSLKAYPQDDWTYSLPFPGMTNSPVPLTDGSGSSGYSAKLLLIEPDSVTNFFETKGVADNLTSYTTQFNSSTYTFDFNNIANVVQNAIDKAPDKDLKLWVIPVLTTWISQSDMYGNTSTADYITSHYLYPSGVTLMKGGDNLKVRVIAADLQVDN